MGEDVNLSQDHINITFDHFTVLNDKWGERTTVPWSTANDIQLKPMGNYKRLYFKFIAKYA